MTDFLDPTAGPPDPNEPAALTFSRSVKGCKQRLTAATAIGQQTAGSPLEFAHYQVGVLTAVLEDLLDAAFVFGVKAGMEP